MTANWQQEILKAIDEVFDGKQGIFLDAETEPLPELLKLTPEQASQELPGAGNSVANQVKHLVTTIAMHKPQFMGGDYPELDWGADWDQQRLTGEEWENLLDQLREGQRDLKQWIAEPVIEQDQTYAAACIMVVTHLAFHIGQIRHAAGYASQN